MTSEQIENKIKSCSSVFFIGIGGVSMSSLAIMTLERGFRVGGSDRNLSHVTEKLASLGIEIFGSHSAENISSYDFAVYTAAVSEDNPEKEAAKRLGIPCVSRGDFLGWIMSSYENRIGVCGTHGKSTTTGMISEIMLDADRDPTIVCGADFSKIGGSYKLGGISDFVFEACEYKDSFLSFCPTVSVITNIELDHPDYFKSIEQLRESFAKYANYSDISVMNFDSANVRLVSKEFKGKKLVTYGIESADTDYRAEHIGFEHGTGEFDVYGKDGFIVHIKLRVPGVHNIYNALAAFSTAYSLGIDAEKISRALSEFSGIKRRFEYKGSFDGVAVYDDYSHHPTEIKAALDGAKRMGYSRIFCVFQPHTYSRTKELFGDFACAFGDADIVIFNDIYAARENNVFGVSSKQLSEAVSGSFYFDSFEATAEWIKKNAHEHDMVVTVGAGDVYKVGNLLLS